MTTTGTSPNYTHTIVFFNVINPATLDKADNTTGGTHTITCTATVQATAFSARGARAVEFDSDGATLDAVYIPVALDARSQYAISLYAAADVVPAAGVFTVDLVDGIGGSVIADDAGTNNSFTFTGAGLATTTAAKSGTFRTPTAIPPIVYVRIRISTAVSAGTSVFIDEVTLVEMTELYTGGPYVAAFSGPTNWVVDDKLTLTVTNDRAGALLEWMDRVFDLRANRLLLPTDSGGTETIADSLIA